MRLTPKLSSSLTFVNEWVLPAIVLICWPAWIKLALRGPKEMWVVAIGWGIACAAVLSVAWPIKKLTIEGNDFLISNYFKTYRVPISQLADVTESHITRPPTLLLHFDPPTPFGKRIRIVPPVGFFNNKHFKEVSAFLRSLLRDKTGENF